jgi:hypothetical protein
MRVIRIGIVRDNVDPLGIGRIRFSYFDEITSEVEKAKDGNYAEWSRDDKFVANPLLPFNINPIPEVGQSIMVFVFDPSKERTNVFYLPGPHTTTHDFNLQRFQDQVTHTTFGLSNDFGAKLFINEGTKKGEYKDVRTKNALAKKEDYGLYGKYGSDVIFTENGLNLRGGKLLSKKFANDADRLTLVDKPLMADRSATLHLKKFPYPLEFQEISVDSYSGATGQLKYMVEYSIDNFTGNTQNISFYIWDTQNAGNDFTIQNIKLNEIAINDNCILLNPQNYTYHNNSDVTTPTTVISGLTGNIQLYVNIRNIINQLHKYGLTRVDNFYKEAQMHPFYFRPTKECLERVLNSQNEINNRVNIFQNINPFDIQQNGLIYSSTSVKPPVNKTTKTDRALVKSEKNQEQTFAALKSDRIYLVSTDTNEFEKIIDFTKIDNYEPTQENYIRDIEPNTYALVRGEVLVDILRSIMDLFESHQHNLTDPLVKEDPNFVRLQTQINTLENDLLNSSIRIN